MRPTSANVPQLDGLPPTWFEDPFERVTREVMVERLGPLAAFLERVAYRDGQPSSGYLVNEPPIDAGLLADARADARFATISELRIASGPPAVYAALAGAPAAVGLRQVDVPAPEIARALIAGGRDQVTHLHDVRFGDPELVDLLGDPTFDLVREVHTRIVGGRSQALIDHLITDVGGFLRRAPRRLFVRSNRPHDADVVVPLLAGWRELAIASLRFDSTTVVGDAPHQAWDINRVELTRASEGTAATLGVSRSGTWRRWLDHIRANVKDLCALELIGADDLVLAEVASALPNVRIIAERTAAG